MSEYTLPTEPGVYMDRTNSFGRLWVVTDYTTIQCAKHVDKCGSWEERKTLGPFTRLMTESQWEAKRVGEMYEYAPDDSSIMTAHLTAVLDKWAQADDDGDENVEPEDGWRLLRDLRALAATTDGSKL